MINFLKKLALGLVKIVLALALVFALFAGYAMYAEPRAEKKAAAICASLTPGADATKLREQAIADGADDFQTRWVSRKGFDELWITYTGIPPYSRHICFVKAKAGRVVSAEQRYLD